MVLPVNGFIEDFFFSGEKQLEGKKRTHWKLKPLHCVYCYISPSFTLKFWVLLFSLFK